MAMTRARQVSRHFHESKRPCQKRPTSWGASATGAVTPRGMAAFCQPETAPLRATARILGPLLRDEQGRRIVRQLRMVTSTPTGCTSPRRHCHGRASLPCSAAGRWRLCLPGGRRYRITRREPCSRRAVLQGAYPLTCQPHGCRSYCGRPKPAQSRSALPDPRRALPNQAATAARPFRQR